MSVGGSKSLNAVCTSNQNDNSRRKLSQTTSVEIAPNTMHLDVPTVQCRTLSATSVVTKCRGGAPPHKENGKNQYPQKGKKHHVKKEHTDIIEMKEFNGQYDEIDVHFVKPYPDMAHDPDEIMIADIKRPRKTEAYTIVHLLADCDGKTNASVQVKIDTRIGGNVMFPRVFERLYPKQMNLNGEPTGLESNAIKHTTYNGMHIPQYEVLRCLLIWKPGNGAKPRWTQTKWNVADAPGPAIVDLPTSERFKVITLNCAVRITHASPKLLYEESHNMVSHDGTSPHPVAQTPKSGYI